VTHHVSWPADRHRVTFSRHLSRLAIAATCPSVRLSDVLRLPHSFPERSDDVVIKRYRATKRYARRRQFDGGMSMMQPSSECL